MVRFCVDLDMCRFWLWYYLTWKTHGSVQSTVSLFTVSVRSHNMLFSSLHLAGHKQLSCQHNSPSLKKKDTNVLHYVNQTLTCMCVYRGFIRRPMKHHTKCNYTHYAWHLAPLHKWSLQLGLMKEAICKTIQIQMTVNFQLLSSALSFALSRFSLLQTPTSLCCCWFFCCCFLIMIPVWSDVTSCHHNTLWKYEDSAWHNKNNSVQFKYHINST